MASANDSEIHLGLSLGINNQCVNNSSSTGAGANANTRSRLDNMTFVGPAPLTELVWSKQKGLGIKSAGKKPCLLSDVGPSSPSLDTKDTYHVESSLGHIDEEKLTADLLPLLATEPKILEGNNENLGLGLKIQERTQFKKEEGSSSAPYCEKVEETAENDVTAKDSSTDNDGSHGSMESCNSANLLSKTNKRWRFEQQLILASKKMKQTQETPVVKQDSSFMNWISNMVKGVKPNHFHNDKTLSLGTKTLGFQTVFQSLYSPDAKLLETPLIENKSVGDNLWITRLSPKTPSNHSNLKTFMAKFSSFNDASASVGFIKTQEDTLTTCFFCGKPGHGLRSCLEINEKEVEGILKNLSLYEGVAKEAPCLCIKCFQLNHWASVCPSKRCYTMIETTNDNEIINQLPSTSVNYRFSSVRKQMFDTIRRLRLSRTDIIKWTNSHFPVTNLDGFFLRLRVAKWEKGVGGAGYYVACITGSQRENPSKGSKKPVRVNIGGVECLVESRYVSNYDFHEDELVAWWQKTWLDGRIPKEEDLNSKLDERKKLGF